MAFPTNLDSLTNKVDGVDYPQAADINNLNDAVEALEAKIGIDNSAVATSIDYKLKNTTAGHDHDGADSKKVITTNLDVTGLTASQLLRVNAGANAVESSGKTVPTGDIVGTSDTQVLTNKTLTSPTINTPTITTPTITSPVINTAISGSAILDEDDFASNSATKVATQQSIKAYIDAAIAGISLAALWPVNSIFISVVSTNPATLLGFGTWESFGAGRTLVGLNSGDTDFDTAEKTGGTKTQSISTHNHTVDVAGVIVTRVNDGSYSQSTGLGLSASVTYKGITENNATHSSTKTTSSGGSATLSTIQPYIVTYMWKRTA